MAAASTTEDPWEEATCSICLDYFKDPVTITCGHNFCRACLTQCWEKSGNADASCPLCWGEVSQRNLSTNWQLANIVAAVKKRNRNSEGEKGGKPKPLKLFCEGDKTTAHVVYDRSKEQYDYRVITQGKAVQDCKNQEEAKMEKIVGEITQESWFLEDQQKHIWAQIEEAKYQIGRKRNDQELSSLEHLILKMQDELDENSLLQRSKKKKTFTKPVAFSPELKWKIQEFCDQKPDLATFMKQYQDLAQFDGRESVKYGAEPQNLRDNPEKFSNPIYVFRNKGFTTHFYAEGFFKGREGSWPVEVATKSVRGKGHVPIGPKKLIRTMGKWIGGYPGTSLPCCCVLSLSEKTKEVQGYLNSAAGQVGFFDVEMGAQIDAVAEVPLSGVSVRPFFYM